MNRSGSVVQHLQGLEEIIVTAQKREQSLRDVPAAVTALTGDTLVANRITDVADLSGLVPGFTVRESAGATGLPSFTMRGMGRQGSNTSALVSVEDMADRFSGIPRMSAIPVRLEALR